MPSRRSARFPHFPRLHSEAASALTTAQQLPIRPLLPNAFQHHTAFIISLFSPYSAYAEDQPLHQRASQILTRAVSIGSISGSLIAFVRHSVPALRLHIASDARPLPVKILLGASTGTVWSVAITSMVFMARMREGEDVQGQDQAWRLPDNEGCLGADNWRYGGMAVTAGTALAIGKIRALGWKAFVGAAGLGSVSGTVGYLAWRYGSGLH